MRLIALLALSLAACDKSPDTTDGDSVDPESWRGVWSGTCPIPDFELTLEWVVRDDDGGSLQGGAELEFVSDAVGHIEIEGDLLGSYDGDLVEATMLFDGYEVTVAGERTSQDEIAGSCEFAGDTAEVTLWR